MMIHNYPPCPHPTSALGIRGHYDTVVLTLLQQDVYGLQILKDGQWIGVEPLPNAFVVNIGFSLEVHIHPRCKILYMCMKFLPITPTKPFTSVISFFGLKNIKTLAEVLLFTLRNMFYIL